MLASPRLGLVLEDVGAHVSTLEVGVHVSILEHVLKELVALDLGLGVVIKSSEVLLLHVLLLGLDLVLSKSQHLKHLVVDAKQHRLLLFQLHHLPLLLRVGLADLGLGVVVELAEENYDIKDVS